MENFKEFYNRRKLQLEVTHNPNATEEQLRKAWAEKGYTDPNDPDLVSRIRFKMMPDANDPNKNELRSSPIANKSSGQINRSLSDIEKAARETVSKHAHAEASNISPAERIAMAARSKEARERHVADVANKQIKGTDEDGEIVPFLQASRIPTDQIAYHNNFTQAKNNAQIGNYPYYRYKRVEDGRLITRVTPSVKKPE